MKELLHCRAQQSLYRQRAAFDPEHTELWLAEAEVWRRKEADAVVEHFAQCNTGLATGAQRVFSSQLMRSAR